LKSEGSLENTKPAAQMVISTGGSSVTIKNTNCKVTTPAGSACEVKGGEVNASATVKSVVAPDGGGGEEMYLEYTGNKTSGETKQIFAQFTLQKCSAEKKDPLDGTYFATGKAAGTPSGATVRFLTGKKKPELKMEGAAAEYTATETVKHASGGEPLSFQTTTT
jgi:hypothetical protein